MKKNNPLPFPDGYFDAVYSHMFLNMRFSLEEDSIYIFRNKQSTKNKRIEFLFCQKPHDKSYAKGVVSVVDKEILDISGFQIRFFKEKDIQDLAAEVGFEMLWIKEDYEEPVKLYLVSSRLYDKTSSISNK